MPDILRSILAYSDIWRIVFRSPRIWKKFWTKKTWNKKKLSRSWNTRKCQLTSKKGNPQWSLYQDLCNQCNGNDLLGPNEGQICVENVAIFGTKNEQISVKTIANWFEKGQKMLQLERKAKWLPDDIKSNQTGDIYQGIPKTLSIRGRTPEKMCP